jgi:hypothetical protein
MFLKTILNTYLESPLNLSNSAQIKTQKKDRMRRIGIALSLLGRTLNLTLIFLQT